MNTLALGLVMIVAQTTVGGDFHSRHAPADCERCGVNSAFVLEEVVQLQNNPSWRVRERMANTLRRIDWRCHPEVVGALSFSLLHDCEDEVREEAAETLARLAKEGACDPAMHESLAKAARSDRDRATRIKARRGLKNLSKRCRGTCNVCEPSMTEVIVPGSTVIVPGEILVPSKNFMPLPEPSEGLTPIDPAETEPVTPARIQPIPSLDSRVAPVSGPQVTPLPPPAADELKPLPDPEATTSKAPSKPVVKQVSPRPRVANRNPGLFRPR